MPVPSVQWDGMVAIPGVRGELDGTCWNPRCLAEGGFHVVGLALDCLLTSQRSTTLRGSPDFFATTCILEHHVTGMLWGTLSSTPKMMSLLISSLT